MVVIMMRRALLAAILWLMASLRRLPHRKLRILCPAASCGSASGGTTGPG